MLFTTGMRLSRIPGVVLVCPAAVSDPRGTFRELIKLPGDGWRLCEAYNETYGTLRGMHYQEPTEEQKFVWCSIGEIWDVALDLRRDSPTFGKHQGFYLVPGGASVLLPPGVAHGYITIREGSMVMYAIKGQRIQAEQRGVRFDDPKFGIRWPVEVRALSERDAAWPNWSDA